MRYYLFGLLVTFLNSSAVNTDMLAIKLNYRADYMNLDGELLEYELTKNREIVYIKRLSGDFGSLSKLREEQGFAEVGHFFIPLINEINIQKWELNDHSILLHLISESYKYGRLYHFSVISDEIYSFTNKPVVKYIYSYDHGIIYFEQLTPIDDEFIFIPYILINDKGLGANKPQE